MIREILGTEWMTTAEIIKAANARGTELGKNGLRARISEGFSAGFYRRREVKTMPGMNLTSYTYCNRVASDIE